ncbi:MAG TPA: ABC transporter permease [Phycisphaerae bacterium]|nr:ABC transporter permease [Phycisphaerae bacterium]
MTVLTPATPRSISWSALRLAVGGLLFAGGTCTLLYAWQQHLGAPAALGIILTCLGIALSIEKTAEAVAIPVGAIVLSLIPFGLFVACAGVNPFKTAYLMYDGAFGSWFSFQNTLTRAAPLMLTGLCTALPMRVGLVIIGGEGALVVGALFAAGSAHFVQGSNPWVILVTMLTVGSVAGGLWIALAGFLKHFRGVNETISSLLLIYIAIALMNSLVEGPWRDPASLNKPSTWQVWDNPDGDMLLGSIHFGSFSMDVHWGLLFGIGACLLCWVLMNHTTFGFAAQVVGGNVRAAKVAGLSLGKLILVTCFLGGAAAGLAGAIEIAAVQGACNATITADKYGYTGILVAFLARQNPLAVIPVAILIGGIGASNGLLQRHLDLPDATVLVLQGFIFLVLLASESYYGKFPFFKREAARG